MKIMWTGFIVVWLCLGVRRSLAADAACAQDKLQGCMSMATALLEDSRLAFPATREEVEGTCKSWTKLLTCMDGYVNDCMDDNEKTEFKQAVGGILEGVRRLCSDPEYQAQYFLHADCIKRTYTEDGLCGSYYGHLTRQVSQEIDATALCCNLRKFETCVVSTTNANCGTTARDFVSALLDKTMGYLVKKCATVQFVDQCSVANEVAPPSVTIVTTSASHSQLAPGTGSSGIIAVAGVGQGPPNSVASPYENRGGQQTQNGGGSTPATRWSVTRQPETLAYGGNGSSSNKGQATSMTITLATVSALLLTATRNNFAC